MSVPSPRLATAAVTSPQLESIRAEVEDRSIAYPVRLAAVLRHP